MVILFGVVACQKQFSKKTGSSFGDGAVWAELFKAESSAPIGVRRWANNPRNWPWRCAEALRRRGRALTLPRRNDYQKREKDKG